MNDLQAGILALLKSAITQEKAELPSAFSLSEAAALIQRQQIIPLIYTGAVYSGMTPASPDVRALFKQHCQHLLYSERQLQACEAVFRAFDAAQIDYLPLKGCTMKELYPRQELRWMSDADVLIRTGQYDRIRPIMQSLGFEEQVESDHELIWNNKQLHIELHKHLIPSYNPDYYSYFGDGWRLARPVSGTRYALSTEDAFIFQFVHFAKHYRDGGAGCRYVLDLWVYRRAYPDMNEAYVRSELKKLQLGEFYLNMLRTIDVWFEGAQPDEKTDFITDFIFCGGSWGNWQNHALAAETRNLHASPSVRANKLKSLFRLAFPPATQISYRYTALKRHPWLLPLIWPLRWVDVLLFRRRSLLLKRSEMKFTTADRVREYRSALRYVGLDFNFE